MSVVSSFERIAGREGMLGGPFGRWFMLGLRYAVLDLGREQTTVPSIIQEISPSKL